MNDDARTATPLAVPLARGGVCQLIEADLEHVVIEIEHASPPGSTVLLEVKGGELGIKVRGCRRVRESPACFRIDGRWVSLSRVQREALGLPRPP